MTLLTPEIARLRGAKKTYIAPEAFGAAAGRYYALAVGDENPLYFDAAFAKAHGLEGVTIPPTLICDTNQYANLPINSDGYAGHEWDIEIAGTRKVRGGNRYVFHRRIRPDDVITATWEITNIEEKMRSSGGSMLIVSSTATYANQHEEKLAENSETIIFIEVK